MKILVTYYSLEGNTQYLAEGIAECLDADLLRLMPVKDIKNNSMKYFFGGKQAGFRNKPKLEPLTFNPEEYDVIIIGTPVWASTITPAVRSFLSRSKFTGKKIGLFCCCRGNQGKAIAQMKELIEGNEILGTIDFREPIKDVLNKKEQACKWAQGLVETAQSL